MFASNQKRLNKRLYCLGIPFYSLLSTKVVSFIAKTGKCLHSKVVIIGITYALSRMLTLIASVKILLLFVPLTLIKTRSL